MKVVKVSSAFLRSVEDAPSGCGYLRNYYEAMLFEESQFRELFREILFNLYSGGIAVDNAILTKDAVRRAHHLVDIVETSPLTFSVPTCFLVTAYAELRLFCLQHPEKPVRPMGTFLLVNGDGKPLSNTEVREFLDEQRKLTDTFLRENDIH